MGYYMAGGTAAPGTQLLPSHGPDPALTAVDDAAPRTYRRMNPANVRALRRSMRRVQSFAKLARGVMSFTQRHKMKRRRRR